MKINHDGEYVLVVCPNPAVDILATIDEFEMGSSNRILKEEHFPGGKGVHVAMALAELGIDVILLGFWGGSTGAWIRSECKRRYPNLQCIGPELENWSRSCYTFKSKGLFNDTEFLGIGPQISDEEYRAILDIYNSYLINAKAIALSGSWPFGADGSAYAKMIRIAHDKSIPTFLDCTGAQFRDAIHENPYCIHLNKKEILEFFNTEDFELAKNQINRYCHVAAITDGARGLYYSTNGASTIHSNIMVENIHSTVGSGDCLLAGIITGHLRGLENRKISYLGVACGAANCMHPELGIMKSKDVDLLLKNLE